MMKTKSLVRDLCHLISEVEQYITEDSDITWTSNDSVQELKAELRKYKKQLVAKDFSCIFSLNVLFAPTGSLQEHSLSNGWSNEFLKLASELDRLTNSLEQNNKSKGVKVFFSKVRENILDFFYPPLCVVCDARLQESEKHICLECISTLPKTNYHKQEENRLEQFLGGRFPFYQAAAFCYFYKTGSLQKIIHAFKYKNNPDLARYIGRLYGEDLKKSSFLSEVDYLIPVPLHPKKQKQRGYNQAEEICKGLSDVTGIPICTTAIERVINNPSQAKKGRTERWENTKGIFGPTNNPSLKGKKVLLVDDVITTGSTIEAIAICFDEGEGPIISVAAIGMAV